MSKETVYASPDGDVHLYKRHYSGGPKDGRLELEIGGWAYLIEELDEGHPLYGVAGGGGPVPERAAFVDDIRELIGWLKEAVEVLEPSPEYPEGEEGEES